MKLKDIKDEKIRAFATRLVHQRRIANKRSEKLDNLELEFSIMKQRAYTAEAELFKVEEELLEVKLNFLKFKKSMHNER